MKNKKTMSEAEFKEILESKGWGFFTDISGDSRWCAYKTMVGWTDCECNGREPSISIRYYEFNIENNTYKSCDIGLRASIPGDNWLDFKFYSLSPEETIKKMPVLIKKLGKAWEAIH